MSEVRLLPDQQWHQLTVSQVLTSLDTDLEEGLDGETTAARAGEYGPNLITRQKGIGRLRLALTQFSQPLVIILLLAGAVTAAIQEWVDSGVIFAVVIVNAIIGYLQEAGAAKAIEALARSMSLEATVVRAGQRLRLPAAELVPGDVIMLQAGDKIPADIRLARSRDLEGRRIGAHW